MKTAQDYLATANAAVPKLDIADGIAKHEEGSALFIDVRDGLEIAASGTIAVSYTHLTLPTILRV